MVDADNKTATLQSEGTLKAVQFITEMYTKHKIIPRRHGVGQYGEQ